MRDQILDSEHYLRTLKVYEIDKNDYFSRLIREDITAIAKDIKESHHRDAETSDENNPLTDVIDVVKERTWKKIAIFNRVAHLLMQMFPGIGVHDVRGTSVLHRPERSGDGPQQASAGFVWTQTLLANLCELSRGTACEI